MSARVAASWQTSLAHLSLILFMIAAAALSRQEAERRAMTPAPSSREAAASPPGTPLAVYLALPGAPPLGPWLSQQPADPRQRLTITAFYGPAPETPAAALAEAALLARQAGSHGIRARIVVEPGRGPARAVLAFDDPAPADAVARSLLERGDRSSEGIPGP